MPGEVAVLMLSLGRQKREQEQVPHPTLSPASPLTMHSAEFYLVRFLLLLLLFTVPSALLGTRNSTTTTTKLASSVFKESLLL